MSDEVLSRLDALASMVAKLGPAPTPTVSVTHLWEVFALANREKLRSWRDYAQRWRDHVGPAFGERPAAAVAPADVDSYRAARRAAGAAVATVNREIALLRRLLNFGVRRGQLARSQLHGPGMTAELIHPENNVRTTVIEEDPASTLTLDDLLEAASPELRAYILVAHQAGPRRTEASRLRWSRITNGVAWIPAAETKGGRSGRYVPLSAAALAALAQLPRGESDWVWPSPRKPGAPIHKDVWTHRFGRLVRKLGLDGPDGGPPWLHDLRRSFVTLARRDGEAERAIMNISGHKTRAVFTRYDIYDMRDALRFRERRDAARAERAALEGPRKGPHRVTRDHHVEEKQVLRKNLVDSKSARA